jgi:hypothetical protein
VEIHVRSYDQHLVCCEDSDRVVANRNVIGSWETITLEEHDGKFAFKAWNGKYIQAPNGGGGPLILKHPWDTPGHAPGPHELFRLVHTVDNGYVIQSDNGMFWSAVNGGGSMVITKHPWDEAGRDPGPDETFTVSNYIVSQPETPSPTPLQLPLPSQKLPPMPSGDSGVLMSIDDMSLRPRLSASQMHSFLPDDARPFVFPSPWRTQAIRLTTEQDGHVHPLGMSFWSNINNSAGRDTLYVYLSIDDVIVIFIVDKRTGEVHRLGDTPFRGTGEYVYFSFLEPDILYVPQDNQLIRYHITRGLQEVVFQASGPIKHVHSSVDGHVHSMTLHNGPAIFRNGGIRKYDAHSYDECQVSKHGNHLLVKANNENTVYDLNTGQRTIITNHDGAVGHADMGWDYVIGEDDQNTNYGGTFRRWNLISFATRIDYYMGDWTVMTRYVSHCNAQPGPTDYQNVLMSSSSQHDLPKANELILVKLGTNQCVAVCPNMNDISFDPDDYWAKTRASIDPTGDWAILTGNCGVHRKVVPILVRLPRW